MNPLWTKLPKESAKAYQAFEIYRDMGSARSIQKVGERLARNHTALARHSKKYDWVKRVDAFDTHVSQEKAREAEKEIIEMQRRILRQAQSFQEIALKLFSRLQERIDRGSAFIFDDHFDNMKMTKVLQFILQFSRMYKEGTRMEAEARGIELKRTIPAPEDARFLADDPEFLKLIHGLIEKRIDEKISGQQNTQANDENDGAGEKLPVDQGPLEA